MSEVARPAALGRLEITITPPPSVQPDDVARYAELGVDRLALLLLGRSEADLLAQVERAAQSLLAGAANRMPMTPHAEKHFTGGDAVRDIVIGMADGLTVPFALAAGLTGAISQTHVIVTAGFAEIAAGCDRDGARRLSWPRAAMPSTTRASSAARSTRSTSRRMRKPRKCARCSRRTA